MKPKTDTHTSLKPKTDNKRNFRPEIEEIKARCEAATEGHIVTGKQIGRAHV